MPKGLLGKKIGMSHIFSEDGSFVPVTYLAVGPCVVVQVKTKEKDGYEAVQLGFDKKPARSTNKPEMSRFKKANTEPLRFIREFKLEPEEKVNVGDKLLVDIFKTGEYVDVTGISIGKGFQGGKKRWHWKGGPASHGSMSHRAPGSIGASASPSRVLKGKHLPGHMGNDKVTVQSLEVVDVKKGDNILAVKGAVPGAKGGYLIIKKSFKRKPKPKKEEKPAEEEPKEKRPKVKKKK